MSDSLEQTVLAAVREVLAGDVDSYEAIYNACNGPLRAFIAWKYGYYGRDFIDDVASRTHIAILERLAAYDPNRGGFMFWVKLLARNAARAEVRFRYGKRFQPFEPMDSYEYPITARGPAEVYEAERTSRILNEALEALPEDYRGVIEQCYEQDKTTQEAAESLGISQPTASRKRNRTLRLLRKRLLDRDIQVVERDPTRLQRWYSPDSTDYDEDWTVTAGVLVPDTPPSLDGKAVRDEREDDD